MKKLDLLDNCIWSCDSAEISRTVGTYLYYKIAFCILEIEYFLTWVLYNDMYTTKSAVYAYLHIVDCTCAWCSTYHVTVSHFLWSDIWPLHQNDWSASVILWWWVNHQYSPQFCKCIPDISRPCMIFCLLHLPHNLTWVIMLFSGCN